MAAHVDEREGLAYPDKDYAGLFNHSQDVS